MWNAKANDVLTCRVADDAELVLISLMARSTESGLEFAKATTTAGPAPITWADKLASAWATTDARRTAQEYTELLEQTALMCPDPQVLPRHEVATRLVDRLAEAMRGHPARRAIVVDASCNGIEAVGEYGKAWKTILTQTPADDRGGLAHVAERVELIYTVEKMPSERFGVLIYLLLATWEMGGRLSAADAVARAAPILDHGQEVRTKPEGGGVGWGGAGTPLLPPIDVPLLMLNWTCSQVYLKHRPDKADGVSKWSSRLRTTFLSTLVCGGPGHRPTP